MMLDTIVKSQKEYYNSDLTKDISFRKNSLEKLLESIRENEQAIYTALKQDLNKSETEAYLTEVSIVTAEIRNAIKKLDSWSGTKKVKTPFTLFPASSLIVKEPYGVVLIMSPWNYPFQLAMAPLIGAIAAGNCAVVKTSKSSPYTSGVIVDIINSTFEKRYIYAIEEALPYDEVLNQPYDYMFFTGSERVGKSVMRSAADRLIPVTLELGGKSPCIIDKYVNVDLAAKKIIWGKTINAGQTCVAPDYVVVHKDVKEELIDKMKKYIKELVGDPFANEYYPRIINLHHYMRLKNLITKESDVIGGRYDDKLLRIEPTIFPNATFDSMIMKDEIFGPILPIIEYEDVNELVPILKSRPKPLACYIFSTSRSFVRYMMYNLPFGGGCVNDVIVHLANVQLPFGGVGNSGMGRYHGKASFDTFTHEKSVLKNMSGMDMALRYPPYDKEKLKMLRSILK